MIAIGDLAYDDDGRGAPCVAGETRTTEPTEEMLETARLIRERADRAGRLRRIQAARSRRQRDIERAIAAAHVNAEGT